MMTSPSAHIINVASNTLVVHDSEGRELIVRRMNALDRLRLFKALGPVLSQNNAYLGMAFFAASVSAIDTVPVPAPVTEGHIETLVARLGDSGIAAVAAALSNEAAPSMGSTSQGN